MNYQVPEYVADNDLICFGLSSHEPTEELSQYSTRAIHDISIVTSSPNDDILVENLVQQRQAEPGTSADSPSLQI